jgi:hypothetical protein
MLTVRFREVAALTLSLVAALVFSTIPACAQSGSQGTIVVTVNDASGALVPEADLTLVASRTNDTRTAHTSGAGTYSFVNLGIGTYKLTIAKPGYATKIYDEVLVQASQTTTLAAALTVGSASDTVQISAESTPLLETSSNEIGTVVDIKQIEDLPLNGRDLTAFSALVAGYNGTYNGLPSTDQGSNIDGVIGASSRMKFGGNIEPAVSPRLEDIEEMSIQTDQLNLNSGFGQSSTQVNFVSRRGSNQLHGRVYEDFRNSWLNANSWTSDVNHVAKAPLKLNDFGGSVGGPVLHDKLFYFGSFATRRVPGVVFATNDIFTSAAQGGNFTYTGQDGTKTVNVLQLAHSLNPSLTNQVNQVIQAQLTAINGAASSGSLTPTADANFNQIAWNQSSPTIYYYPAVRVDYNLSQKARMYLSWLMTKQSQPGVNPPDFPGSTFADEGAGNATKNYTSSYGFDYTFSPQLLNQFKAGFLYDSTLNSYNAAPLYLTQPIMTWNYPGGSYEMSGQQVNFPINTYYPIFNLSDSMTWQRGKHTIQYGVSWYREQDHYWNAPAGFNNYSLGLATGDPALNVFTGATPTNPDAGTLPGATSANLSEAEQLYAVLTGRIAGVSGESPFNIKAQQYNKPGQIGEYPLDELSRAFGIFAEDSWKVRPSLTLNYGLRWDFTGAQHDLTGLYHSASISSIYGPSGVGNLFHPGTLGGNLNPSLTASTNPYNPWRVTPQPSIGFAWNPRISDGPLKSLLGDGKTVVRAGFALRRFTEPYQYFWDNATDYGSFYYQMFYLNPNTTGQQGTFTPGSLSMGQSLPAFGLSPNSYQATAPESEFTFQNSTPVYGLDKGIKQPYSESWNFGIQRDLGHSLALEVRYNGNRTIHQWINIDPNEVNVFENGFLSEFKKAQSNLASYIQANPGCTTAGNCSFQGAANSLPIMTAAFGGPGAADFTNSQFVNYLNTGQVGKLAGTLAGIQGTVPYLCNMVGSSFSPCATNAGYTGGGAGYPINFWQANPYASDTDQNYGPANGTGQLISSGYSNYNALQVDLRQGNWHGLQYDANYTWSHSLGVASNNQWTGAFNAFSLRNLAKSYGPSLFDLRHVLHANGTYDLPFGRGRQFLNKNGILDKAIGGWTVGTILTYQSGEPAQLTGEYGTFNDYADSGVTLHNVTPSQLEKSVGVYRVPGQTFADLINPKYLSSTTGGGANSQYITPNTTPGTIGNVLYLHGPNQYYQDISLTKIVPIHESIRFRLQASFLNAWNHPVFGDANGYGSFDAGVQDYGFGLGGVTNESSGETPGFGRVIEIRANIDF